MFSLHALNLAALLALRFLKPKDAYGLIGRIGAKMPRRIDEATARDAVGRLKPLGTCLSRSLAIAARLPNAEVVIGVRKDQEDGDLRAHAWVEVAGRPLVNAEMVGDELARL
jgi:Transglutaminase-like superfamily